MGMLMGEIYRQKVMEEIHLVLMVVEVCIQPGWE